MAPPSLRSLTLDLGLRHTFQWIFIIADIHTPIIGADFLREHGLLVNMKHKRLADTITALQTKGTISHNASPSPSLLQCSNMEYDAILADFPSVTKPCTSTRPVKHTTTSEHQARPSMLELDDSHLTDSESLNKNSNT